MAKAVYMTQKESTNVIIRLLEKGWSYKEIVEFIAFIPTHDPSEDEVKKLFKSSIISCAAFLAASAKLSGPYSL